MILTACMGNRLNKAAMAICITAMDACWAYTVAWLFAAVALGTLPVKPVPPPPILFGLALGSWLVAALLMDRTGLPTWLVQALTGVLGVAASLVVMALWAPPQGSYTFAWLAEASYGLIVALGFWALGLFRASGQTTFNGIFLDFQVGLIIVAVGTIFSGAFVGGKAGALWAGIGGLPFWFFGWSLVALALSNREVVEEEVGEQATGSWTGILIPSIGGILLLGGAISTLSGQNLFVVLAQVFQGVLVGIGAAVYWVLYGAVWLWSQFFKINVKPLDRPATDPADTGQPGQVSGRPAVLPSGSDLTIPQQWIDIGTWVLIGLVVVAVAWLIGRQLRRVRRRPEPDINEERERLGSWALLMRQVKAWLARLLARFRKPAVVAQEERPDELAALAGKPEWSGTLSVRQIYARLQRAAARRGFPRRTHQTPVEYLVVLTQAMPTIREDLEAITSAYLQARYGPMPAPEPAVQAAREAWERTKDEMRTMPVLAQAPARRR